MFQDISQQKPRYTGLLLRLRVQKLLLLRLLLLRLRLCLLCLRVLVLRRWPLLVVPMALDLLVTHAAAGVTRAAATHHLPRGEMKLWKKRERKRREWRRGRGGIRGRKGREGEKEKMESRKKREKRLRRLRRRGVREYEGEIQKNANERRDGRKGCAPPLERRRS